MGMDMIELWSGTGTRAIIDPIGGWILNLSDEYGDVLYPRRTFTALDGTKKQRGGCHVCLPNFGPGGESGLVQHGFGRTEIWQIASREQMQATLELPTGQGEYTALSSRMTISIESRAMHLRLELENTGTDTLRVAPGFHPYFSLTDDESVTVNGEPYQLDELAGTEFIDGTTMQLVTSHRTLTLDSDDLTTWALWTDQLGPYVCLEPTFRGNTFLENPQDDELLPAGEARVYTATLQWN